MQTQNQHGDTDDPEEVYYLDFYDYLMKKYEMVMRTEIGGRRTPLSQEYPIQYKEWLNLIGGEKQLFLRNFLKPFKLA